MCSTEHSCGQVKPGSYPTRLLYVGNTASCTLRLCTATEVQAGEKYMTLSHCWGMEKFFTLTLSNYDSLRQHIDPNSLTKTFQEAITATKALKIQYLWIDSLCIIQDSPEDWEIESAQMNEIYSNSYCNIERWPGGTLFSAPSR
jgi:hypothetical protein